MLNFFKRFHEAAIRRVQDCGFPAGGNLNYIGAETSSRFMPNAFGNNIW